MDQQKLTEHLRTTFSAIVDLPAEELYGKNLSLSDIMARSSGMTNSVDLMEAFAKSAKSVRQNYGVRLRLPALPLSTPINEVLDLLVAQALEVAASQTAAPQAGAAEAAATEAVAPESKVNAASAGGQEHAAE